MRTPYEKAATVSMEDTPSHSLKSVFWAETGAPHLHLPPDPGYQQNLQGHSHWAAVQATARKLTTAGTDSATRLEGVGVEGGMLNTNSTPSTKQAIPNPSNNPTSLIPYPLGEFKVAAVTGKWRKNQIT
jgi:hypothetical protein